MSNWDKEYGIDDEGHRVIMVTEKSSKSDKTLSTGLMLFIAAVVIYFAVDAITKAAGGFWDFVTSNPIIWVVIGIVALLFFVGRVKRTMDESEKDAAAGDEKK